MQDFDLSQYYRSFSAQIKASSVQNRLPHGILLNNIDHLELDTLLHEICCVLVKKEELGDLTLTPGIFYLKGEHGQIKIDQVKDMLEEIYLSSYHSSAKVVIISPLEALNISAANALLKSLEEPPENTYFLMTSNHLQWIMPTLRSRVQVFDIVLEHEQKEDYLAKKYQLSYKDVEKALQVSRNELAVVDRIKTDNDFWQLRKALIRVLTGELSPLGLSIDLSAHYKDVLYWLTSFVIDAYYLRLGVSSLAHQDQELFIQNFSRRYNHLEIYQYYQRLLKLKAYEGKHFNVNKQLAVESLLVELCV